MIKRDSSFRFSPIYNHTFNSTFASKTNRTASWSNSALKAGIKTDYSTSKRKT
jgi:hypothetical protein